MLPVRPRTNRKMSPVNSNDLTAGADLCLPGHTKAEEPFRFTPSAFCLPGIPQMRQYAFSHADGRAGLVNRRSADPIYRLMPNCSGEMVATPQSYKVQVTVEASLST